MKGFEKVKAKKKPQAEEDGQREQGDGQEMLQKNKKKSSRKGSDEETSQRSKRTKSDDEGSALERNKLNGATVNLEAIKRLLRKKGAGTTKSKGSGKDDKKTATFAEAASKEVPRKSEPGVKYNKCVVAFAIQVNMGNNAEAGFDKKMIAALSFIQTYIDKHAASLPIDGLDPSKCSIKEKADLPAFQVVLRSYFEIPNPRAFDSVNQEGGRAIKGSAVMGFSLDPKKSLVEAAGDLWNMGCAIYYKQCQEVSMIARQILLAAPNTVEEDIKQTLDEELKLVEQNCCRTTTITSSPKTRGPSGSTMPLCKSFVQEYHWRGQRRRNKAGHQ